MNSLQTCWHCDTPYPQEDLRGRSNAEDTFHGQICVKCKIKESLRHEIRKAQDTLQMIKAVTSSLDGWKPFDPWAQSNVYKWHNDLPVTYGNFQVFTHSYSRRFAFIWLCLGRWYGGIASLLPDDQTLVPVEMRWGMGGYVSPSSAAAHALYYLGLGR